jgi:hypothetical protein
MPEWKKFCQRDEKNFIEDELKKHIHLLSFHNKELVKNNNNNNNIIIIIIFIIILFSSIY